jgi:hypothetical protein
MCAAVSVGDGFRPEDEAFRAPVGVGHSLRKIIMSLSKYAQLLETARYSIDLGLTKDSAQWAQRTGILNEARKYQLP